MSYPYDLDVVFNSEQAAADSIGRLSFGTSSGGGSGDKILFRTRNYPVSNDYELINTGTDGAIQLFPVFNTQKEAYTEVEIKKSDWDSLPEDKKADLQLLFLQYAMITSSSVSFYGVLIDSSSPQNQNKNIFLTSQDIDITSQNPPDCTLTSVTAKLYIRDMETSTLTEVCTCKVKTYIDGAENKDSSYIPVLNNGLNNPVPVTRVEEDHTNFMYKTEPFKMNVGTGFGTDETVTVIAAFSNPVGITLDELVGFVYTIENGKSFTTFIHDTNWNTELRADIPGNYQDPDFQFPVTLTYSNEDSSISVQADIYTLDGNRPSTPITLGSMQERSVTIIKKT